MIEDLILIKLKNMCKDIEEASKKAEYSTLHFGPTMNDENIKTEDTPVMNYYEPEKSMFDDYTILGSCSICGGPVAVPKIYFSIFTPVPKCLSCGAYKKESYGPVIEMEK